MTWRLGACYPGRVVEGLDALTARQREVLALLAKGLSNREIAGVLGISASTVKTHVENLLRLLDVTNRAEATSGQSRAAASRS